MERKIVTPGEMIVEGEDYLPGEWTEKREGKIYSLRYGLAEENSGLIKIFENLESFVGDSNSLKSIVEYSPFLLNLRVR